MVQGGLLVKFWQNVAFSESEQLIEVAKIAEELGFFGITTADHIITPETINSTYPYAPDGKAWWDPNTHFPDTWVMYAALAQHTQRLHFMPTIYIVPARDPFTLAKAVSSAAFFSDNRVIVGLGVGWMAEEFDLTGQSWTNRGRRTDEMLDVMAQLMAGGMVEYHGKYYDFPPIQMAPATTKPVPVWIGGHSEPALARAARHDGWIGVNYNFDDIPPLINKLTENRKRAGTDHKPFDIFVTLNELPDADTVKRLRDLGVTSYNNPPWLFEGIVASDLAQKRASMERFAERLIRPING
jgi:probable F420-dependent oxidoreductase